MKILLVGPGGYGTLYLNKLLENTNPEIVFEGIVEKFFDSCPQKQQILDANIPVYETLEAFYEEHSADLAFISTPPFLHCEQSIYCVEHGSNVLCEKPAAPTVSEVEKMMAAEKKYGKFIAIGYQWSFSDAIQELKRDIIDGSLGKAVSFKTLVSWPRNKAYYSRGGGWGGRISKDGILVLDSIASNACAHYIHNMFFLLGKTMESSACPQSVDAECLRANNIENFDTCILKMHMPDDVKLYFAATHAAKVRIEPEFVYEFENAEVKYNAKDSSDITAYFKDGTVKNYGNPLKNDAKKLFDCIDAVKTGALPICTCETAVMHTKLIGGLYKNVKISDFPDELKGTLNDGVYIEGLYEKICAAYENQSMLSELGYEFSNKYSFKLKSE